MRYIAKLRNTTVFGLSENKLDNSFKQWTSSSEQWVFLSRFFYLNQNQFL